MGLLRWLEASAERDRVRAQAKADDAIARMAAISAARIKAMVDAGMSPEDAGRAEAARSRALDRDDFAGGGGAA